MNRVIVAAILAAAAGSGAMAQGRAAPIDPTAYRDGTWWNGKSFFQKVGYLEGLADAIATWNATEMEIYLGDQNKPPIMVGEYVVGIDKLYADKANLRLPILAALLLFTAKTQGATPELLLTMREESLRGIDEEIAKEKRKALPKLPPLERQRY